MTRFTRTSVALAALTITLNLEAAAITASPVGHWTLDEASAPFIDSAGSNDLSWGFHENMYVPEEWKPAIAQGRIAACRSFESEDVLRGVHDGTLDPATITVCAWVNPSADGGQGAVVSKGQGWASEYWGLHASGADEKAFARLDIGGTDYGTESSAGTLPANAWSHIAMSYDGTSLKLYVNGQLAGTASAGATKASGATDNIAIGRDGTANPVDLMPYTGVIDDIRIYDSALSDFDIADIFDAAPPVVAVTASDSYAMENSSNTAEFTITRTTSSGAPATSGDLAVDFALSGSATEGIDFVAVGTQVTIGDGTSTATVTIDTASSTNDATAEGPETVTLTIAASALYGINQPGSSSVTIADDDVASVSISAASDADETGSVGSFDVVRVEAVTGVPATSGDLTVNYTASGTATSGADYIALSGLVTILDGDSSASIDVTAIDDATAELAETVIVTLVESLSPPPYNIEQAGTTAEIDILDSDSHGPFMESNGQLLIEAEHFTEANQRTDTVNWTIATDEAGFQAEGYMTTSNTADPEYADWDNGCELVYEILIQTAGTYYIAMRHSSPGSWFPVALGLDGAQLTDMDPNWAGAYGWYWSQGSAPLGALSRGVHTLHIRRNSRAWGVDRIWLSTDASAYPPQPYHGQAGPDESTTGGIVSITTTLIGASELLESPGEMTIVREGDLSATLELALVLGGTASAADYAEDLSSVQMLPGETSLTLAITPVDDTQLEGTETLTVTLGSSLGYVVGAESSASLDIEDYEPPIVRIEATDAEAHELTPPGTGTYTVTRTHQDTLVTAGDLAVSYSIEPTSTASASDYVALSGTVTILDGDSSATITLTPIDDTEENEPDETVILVIEDAPIEYDAGTPSTATVTIRDDDVKPAAFGLVAPGAGQVGIALLPAFDWEDAYVPRDSIAYQLEVASDAAFTSITLDVSVTGASFYAATSSDILMPDATYYWRVTASNAYGATQASNALFSFSTTATGSALDWDGDGLENTDEAMFGTNPSSSDTDGDGMPDLYEIINGLDPLVDDGDEDSDGDLVSNSNEYADGTDPQVNGLPGIGQSTPGCSAGTATGSSAGALVPLAVAAALLLSIMRRASSRSRFSVLSVVLAAALTSGCGDTATALATRNSAALLSLEPAADLSRAQASNDFPSGWSPVGGACLYMGADEMDPRMTFGGYYHTMESDDSRIEIAIMVAPDTGHFGSSEYLTLASDYLGYLGEEGSVFWRAGAGGLVEIRGESTDTYLLLEGGAGLWLTVAPEKVLYLNATFQAPIGEGGKVGTTMMAVTAGYDF